MKQSDLARELDIGRSQVSKLVARGMPTDSREAAEAWRRQNLDPAKRDSARVIRKREPAATCDDRDGFDLTDERARLAHHQANIAALDEDVKRKVLIPAEQVRAKWQDMLASFRARLLALPTRVAASCVGLDEAQIEKAARELVHQALQELARGDGVR